ncbi:MAG: carboxypeptidase-like regulatory domain-containing protein [Candidatus Bathyarchaeia archaeon]
MILVFIMASTFNSQTVEGQGGAVRGRVYARDALGNYVPAGFVTITVIGDSFKTYTSTDQEGYFIIYLPVGVYNMTATLSTFTLLYVKSVTVAIWHGSDTTINFYLERATVKPSPAIVSVSVDGLPPQYVAELTIDGSPSGKIRGGSTLQVEVDLRIGHTISVAPYIEGTRGERFYCADNTWHLESSDQPIEGVRATKTFHYTTQYLLAVSTPYGEAAKNSGWHNKDTLVHLSTPEILEVAQGVRDIFDYWNVNGEQEKGSTINIVLNKPLEAKAEYHREYYLTVRSEYGNPSGSGWFREGYTAMVKIEREAPMQGFVGFLGGRRVFEGWSGDVSSESNVVNIYVDGPKTLVATWREDYTTPYVVAALIIITIFALAAIRKMFS